MLPSVVLALVALVLVRAGAWPGRSGASASERRLRRQVARLEGLWQRAAERAVEPCAARTPLAWAQWAAQRDPLRFSGAPEAIESYYKVRFGQGEVSASLMLQLRRLGRTSRGWRPAPYSKDSDQNSSVS